MREVLREREAGKFLIPFLYVGMEFYKRKDTFFFYCLAFTHLTNLHNLQKSWRFFFFSCSWPCQSLNLRWAIINSFVFSLSNILWLLSGNLGLEHLSPRIANWITSPLSESYVLHTMLCSKLAPSELEKMDIASWILRP